MRPEDLAGAQGSGEVGVDDAGPLLFREVECGLALDDAGAVDQDVDFAEAVKRGGEELIERGAVADVRCDAECLAAEGFDCGGGFIYLLLAACGGDDIGAGFREADAQGAADARGATGDDCNFSFKTE